MKDRCWFIVLFLLFVLLLPHDSIYAKEAISLEVQPVTEDKIWNSFTPRDQNPNGKTDTYYYPWAGNNDTKVTGFRFVNLTEKKQSLIEKYDVTVESDLENDIISAVVSDMNFLGQRPVSIVWNKKPTLKIEKQEQADSDGIIFVMKLKDAVCNVVDNKEGRITEDDWESYYDKAKESCSLVLKYQEERGSFGSKDNPGYGSSDSWCVLTAARCGYIPYNDVTWFERWFVNTKAYLEEKGADYISDLSSTDVAKLILAIEATGHDPRDVSGMDLLEIEGRRNGTNVYGSEYAIHSIKAGGYLASTFDEDEMETWVHKRAESLKNSQDSVYKNADNALSWQPLVYWYGKEGFEDVTATVDAAIPRFASVAQRATGAFCTEGYEESCPMYGNNAWNDAQALLFAGEFGVNVIRPESGFTKNGNNILDAVFALINYEEGTIPGFYNYDPAQIARGLNSFVRTYERDIMGKDSPPFWIFSDVEVPTRAVNDAILALCGKSSDQDILNARAAYEALDDVHKAIFNQEYYNRLIYFESGGRDIEAAREAIEEIPKYSLITLVDKENVENARAMYGALPEEKQGQVEIELVNKLVQAEAKIKALEVAYSILKLDKNSTDEEISAVRELYDALSQEQQAVISDAFLRLVYYESGGKYVDPVVEQIMGLPDSEKCTLDDKKNVVSARSTYEALSPELKKLLPKEMLSKLKACEETISKLEEAAKKKEASMIKKGNQFIFGGYKYLVTSLSGKNGEITFVGTNNKKLTKISIPAKISYQGYNLRVTAIGRKSLSGYKKLSTIIIGISVKEIGKQAFLNCSKLKKLTIKTKKLKKVGLKAFKGIHKKAVIKVPKKKIKEYKKLLKGKGQKKTVKIK